MRASNDTWDYCGHSKYKGTIKNDSVSSTSPTVFHQPG